LSFRKNRPYNYFFSANFLIHKKLFSNILFNENLFKYGHEDTLFALDLKRKNIQITHIDNFVFHKGIELNNIFIKKTKESVENLFYLYQKKLIVKNDTRLIDTYIQLKSLKISTIYAYFFKIFNEKIELNICSKNPSLLLYDLYKLGYLCSISR